MKGPKCSILYNKRIVRGSKTSWEDVAQRDVSEVLDVEEKRKIRYTAGDY